MALHRSSGRPDWLETSPEHWNGWQRTAAATNGILTPGNVVSLLGLALVAIGLVQLGQHHYWAGFIWLIAGRFGDLLDGWLAEHTGTKSPLGELVDETFDKFAFAATIIVVYTLHIAPLWLLVVMVLPQITIAGGAVVGLRKHWNLHPSRLGKIGMAGFWIFFGGLLLIRATGVTGTPIHLIIDGFGLLIGLLNFRVGAGYWRQRNLPR